MPDDEQHLAGLMALLGPPSPEFLARSTKSGKFWDDQGMNPRFLRKSSKRPGDDSLLFHGRELDLLYSYS